MSADEELRLEADLQAMTQKMSEVFLKTREADKCFSKIREEIREKQDRLLQITVEKGEKGLRERHLLREHLKDIESENVRLRNEHACLVEKMDVLTSKNSDQDNQLQKLKENLRCTESSCRTQEKENREKDEEIEKLKTRVKGLVDEVSKLQLHESAKNSTEMQESRRQSKALVELKENLQNIFRLSQVQQNTIEHLEDELSAGQQITVETQLQQLDELQSLSDELKQLKQTLTADLQQQKASEKNIEGKYVTDGDIYKVLCVYHLCIG